MKLNKIISKGLVLSLFISNLNNLTFATGEISGRYETLEGDYITIDDSMEGNLEEIEIFGNTIQDENNLEDIQSVGDLYVDESGNPILDKRGRKQYKVDVVNSNRFPIIKNEWKALLTKELSFSNRYSHASFNTFGYTKPGDHVRIHLKIKKISDSYNFSNPIALTSLDSGGYNQYLITNSEWINLPVGESIEKTIVRTIDINTDRSYVSLHVGQAGDNTDPTSNTGTFIIEDVGLDIMSSPTTEIKENKTTILLPTQLQKIGDIADRLYWDDAKNRYVIEKNIGKFSFTKDMGLNFRLSDNGMLFRSEISTAIPNLEDILAHKSPNIICNKLKPFSANTLYAYKYEGISMYSTGLPFIVNNIDVLDTPDVSGVRKWIDENKLFVYYAFKTSQLIDTNIISKLKIPTYNEKTYIYTSVENNVNPKLKVIVDRLPQIAGSAVEEARINSDTSNISLARMYVNMLPESLYKDQLHERLNQIFSSDITLDRESVSSNLDIYVKSQNMLSMSLDTNSVTFDGYSGAEDMEMLGAVNISINSSLPYSLNAYMPNEISNADKSETMPIDILNIRDESESAYQTFFNTTDKVVLKDSCNTGNDLVHNIDLKLSSNQAYKADVYKTVIKFEAEQK